MPQALPAARLPPRHSSNCANRPPHPAASNPWRRHVPTVPSARTSQGAANDSVPPFEDNNSQDDSTDVSSVDDLTPAATGSSTYTTNSTRRSLDALHP